MEENDASRPSSEPPKEPTASESGLTLEEMYDVAVKHFKQVRDDLTMSYEDRLNVVAYWRQATRGKWEASKTKDVGYFDVVGNDRIKAWRALGDATPTEAKQKFVDALTVCSSQLQGLFLERKAEKEERERRERETREREEREQREREEEAEAEAERKRREEEEERRKREEEQKLRQAELDQLTHPVAENLKISQPETVSHSEDQPDVGGGDDQSDLSKKVSCVVQHTSNAAEFISEMQKDPDCCIVIGRGECVTVRVPTRAGGSALYWEFATENFDIAFGLSFEWGFNVASSSNGEEAGSESSSKATSPDAATRVDPILPVLRRNSHTEVIAGRHRFPGDGVYLLQFDNSYSMVRSKTLYYRVYYTK